MPPTDELPYVFEISRGQTLFFSISSSHEVDLVLCEEGAYDDWVDAGFETDRPLEALLVCGMGLTIRWSSCRIMTLCSWPFSLTTRRKRSNPLSPPLSRTRREQVIISIPVSKGHQAKLSRVAKSQHRAFSSKCGSLGQRDS